MESIIKHYTNGEVTVVWKSGLCTHSCYCWKGLPKVFKPREQPWIQVENSDTEKIISQIKQCPSGALTYEMNSD